MTEAGGNRAASNQVQEPFDQARVGDTRIECDYCWRDKFGPHPHSPGGSGARHVLSYNEAKAREAQQDNGEAGSTVDSWAEMLRFYPDPLAQIESEMNNGLAPGLLAGDRIKALVSHVKALRADLEAAQGECTQRSEHHAHYHTFCSMGGNTPCSHEADLAQARARIAVLERVAQAAKADVAGSTQRSRMHLIATLAALDAQQAGS